MKEYRFLNIARNVFKVLAWLVLVIGIVVGIIVLVTGGAPAGTNMPNGTPIPQTPRAAGVVFVIMGALYFMILYTIAEVIGLLLDIKSNCKPPIIA
ncbi:MAG: hypothetical protein V2A72_08270 [Candidatus Omnitrophota bacterium]